MKIKSDGQHKEVGLWVRLEHLYDSVSVVGVLIVGIPLYILALIAGYEVLSLVLLGGWLAYWFTTEFPQFLACMAIFEAMVLIVSVINIESSPEIKTYNFAIDSYKLEGRQLWFVTAPPSSIEYTFTLSTSQAAEFIENQDKPLIGKVIETPTFDWIDQDFFEATPSGMSNELILSIGTARFTYKSCICNRSDLASLKNIQVSK